MQGRGQKTWVNGDIYDGDWFEGKKQGKRICIFVNEAI